MHIVTIIYTITVLVFQGIIINIFIQFLDILNQSPERDPMIERGLAQMIVGLETTEGQDPEIIEGQIQETRGVHVITGSQINIQAYEDIKHPMIGEIVDETINQQDHMIIEIEGKKCLIILMDFPLL